MLVLVSAAVVVAPPKVVLIRGRRNGGDGEHHGDDDATLRHGEDGGVEAAEPLRCELLSCAMTTTVAFYRCGGIGRLRAGG